MMREFQAENEQKQLNTENNHSTCEENDDETDRSTDVNSHQMKLNTSEKKSTYEKPKFQLKTNRYPSDLIKVEFLYCFSFSIVDYFRHHDVRHTSQMFFRQPIRNQVIQ